MDVLRANGPSLISAVGYSVRRLFQKRDLHSGSSWVYLRLSSYCRCCYKTSVFVGFHSVFLVCWSVPHGGHT
ncbi:hypothetical protein CONLIGDRAFT_366297 [Coniochaeta ligniaria NRRL 30616]|uniref:Uncharacterized protein n=1 Tax=Coniochaeta ligniaria NRRL 30616 TaxID=1408157 RepID=A0A1J7IT62_9PEZI|nr:hypothetical protein CONLIGDRAFT_366297 [Coniochaeta ligniaria NRRL 30616]